MSLISHAVILASPGQRSFIAYIAANPGCCVADVDRACRRNPDAGHKCVYDVVAHLVLRGIVRSEWVGSRKTLYVVEA